MRRLSSAAQRRGSVPPQPEALPDVPAGSSPPAGRSARAPRPVDSIPILVAVPHLPHRRFESLDTLRRYCYPPLAIVGIPAKAVLPPLQFLIQRLQIDVGQQ